ncbi:hypothetical protein [Terriglobus roseus]|uniref:Uncharacterized protein n=1 Tax=Terriglobus roseus TaxID=392734 RepID=A0A1H4IYV1_9BACT|nr:hypothetical protein [Terriglobus roseus]SEB39210.1 hypothetical protein SAMN05443244_0217 [Terriglobus roseus]
MMTKLAVHTVTREETEQTAIDGVSPVLLRPLNKASRAEIERLARVLFRGAEGSARAILLASLEDDGGSSEWVALHIGHALASNGSPTHVLCLQQRSEAEPADRYEVSVVLSERCKAVWVDERGTHEDTSRQVGLHLIEARKCGAQAIVHVSNLLHRPGVLTCSRLLDGAALLVRSGYTRKLSLAAARQQIAAADLAVLGGILTDQTHPIPEKIYRML